MVHADSFRINISIEYMHRLTAIILDVSNVSQNTNVPINERVCVSPPPYYLDFFERYYPNVPLNRYDGPFLSSVWMEFKEQRQLKKKRNRLLDAVVTIIKYKKSTIDHDINIKVFTHGTVSYLTVSTDNVINDTNNKERFY